MQALSAASRCSCGLAEDRLVPPISPGFVDMDREPARNLLAADLAAVDLRATARLALPGRADMPVGGAFGGVG
jgi:hypothetical protein